MGSQGWCNVSAGENKFYNHNSSRKKLIKLLMLRSLKFIVKIYSLISPNDALPLAAHFDFSFFHPTFFKSLAATYFFYTQGVFGFDYCYKDVV